MQNFKMFFIMLSIFFLIKCAEKSKEGCNSDADCGYGKVCEENKCVSIECEEPCSQSSCKSGQVCVTIGDKNFCTFQECGPEKNCPSGKICECGVCKEISPAEFDDVFVDVPPEKIEEEEISTFKNLTCLSCDENPNICGTSYICSPLGADKYCLLKCTNDGDCEPGFVCYAVTTEGKQCVPAPYKCVKCITEPCPEGKVCNLSTGECIEPKPQCDKCAFDYECMKGFRCYKGFCVPSCKDTNCPKDFKCITTEKGVKLCEPTGEGCGGCPKEKPFLKDGKCVECLNSTHCPSPKTCNLATNTCEGQCPSGTYECADKKCHQCCEDIHCKGIGQEKCDKITYTCVGAACTCTPPCTSPYPACVEISPGNCMCVQCANDLDCPSNCKCNKQLYTCEAQGGGPCIGPLEKCKSDSDCPPNQNFPNLACHPEGFCYDKDGGCDGITAFCKPGFQCFSILDLIGGGGIPMPGMPVMGICTCNSGQDCPVEGTTCLPISILCIFLPELCQGQPPPNVCFNLGLPF